MAYAHDIGNGQRLLVENDGDHAQVALSSGDSANSKISVSKTAKFPDKSPPGDDLCRKLSNRDGFLSISL
jgi:hypothetical protein